MKPKVKLLIMSFLGVGSVTALLLCYPKDSNIDKCQEKLRALHGGVAVMRDDYGRYPTNLESVLEYFGASPSNCSLLNCPGTRGFGFRTNLLPIRQDFVARKDYFYFDWSTRFGDLNSISNGWPLIVDRRVGNHHGKGVNVCLVNGNCFWDGGARWFRDFTNRHPEIVVSPLE